MSALLLLRPKPVQNRVPTVRRELLPWCASRAPPCPRKACPNEVGPVVQPASAVPGGRRRRSPGQRNTSPFPRLPGGLFCYVMNSRKNGRGGHPAAAGGRLSRPLVGHPSPHPSTPPPHTSAPLLSKPPRHPSTSHPHHRHRAIGPNNAECHHHIGHSEPPLIR
eukprot:scaffold2630_cov118-Isochrysis_galbana.AAC.4